MTLGRVIFASAAILGVIILIVDHLQIKSLEKRRKNEPVDTSSWQAEYAEATEDRRQYTNLTWQIPSAILVADGIAISFAYSKDVHASAPWWAPTILLLAAFGFNVVMYLNFWKFAYRSYSRFLRIQTIERQRGMRRVGDTEPIPIRWGTWKWMSFLIIMLSAGLLYLAMLTIRW